MSDCRKYSIAIRTPTLQVSRGLYKYNQLEWYHAHIAPLEQSRSAFFVFVLSCILGGCPQNHPK